MILYTGACVCVICIGNSMVGSDEEVNKYFGTLSRAIYSHFCMVTLENWPNIANAAMQQNGLWAFYFVFMIALTNVALVNLMVGCIVERIIRLSAEQEDELSAYTAESEQF